MKLLEFAFALVCSLALAASTHAAAQHSHAEHEAGASQVPPPTPAQRWATDAALREGMHQVRSALDELAHYEMGQLPKDLALERVASIEEATRSMFANCKLAPDADAALHGLLVPLLAAAGRFKADPEDMSQIVAMRRAVADYPRIFDDPQFPAKN